MGCTVTAVSLILSTYEMPDDDALNSPLLCHEPDGLKVDEGLPMIDKSRFKQGVYY